MWISRQISNACKLMKNAKIGKITATQNRTVTVQAEQEYREISNVAPFGIVSIPPVGEKAVITHTENGFVYAGVPACENDLEPGELMLFSRGGASIVLKNNGQVLINGKAIE